MPVQPWDARGPPRPVIDIDTDGPVCPMTGASSPSTTIEQDEERRTERWERSAPRRGEGVNGSCEVLVVKAQGGSEASGAMLSGDSVCDVEVGERASYANGSALQLGGGKRQSPDAYVGDSDCHGTAPITERMAGQPPIVVAKRPVKRARTDHMDLHDSVPPERVMLASDTCDDETEVGRHDALSGNNEVRREVERVAGADYEFAACDVEETLIRPKHHAVIRSRGNGSEIGTKSGSDLAESSHIEKKRTTLDSSLAASPDIDTANFLRWSEGLDKAIDEGIEDSLGYDAQTFANHWRSAIIEEALVAYRIFAKALDRNVNHLCAPVDLPTLHKMMLFIGKELGASTRMEHAPSGIRVAYFRPRSSTIFPKSEETFCDTVSTIVDRVINARFNCSNRAVRKTSTTEKEHVDSCPSDQPVNNSSNGDEFTADRKSPLNPSKKAGSLASSLNSGGVQEFKDRKVQRKKAWPLNSKMRATVSAARPESEKDNKLSQEDLGLPAEDSETAIATKQPLLGDNNAGLSQRQGNVEAGDAGRLQKTTASTLHEVLPAENDGRQRKKNDKEGLFAKLQSWGGRVTSRAANATDGLRGRIGKSGRVKVNTNKKKMACTRQQAREGQQQEAQLEALKRIQREMKERKVLGASN